MSKRAIVTVEIVDEDSDVVIGAAATGNDHLNIGSIVGAYINELARNKNIPTPEVIYIKVKE